jgi:hypothetical protein
VPRLAAYECQAVVIGGRRPAEIAPLPTSTGMCNAA